VLPDVKIIYTLHEYLAMCYSQGQLFRYHERAICHQPAPDQCVKCFPGRSVEEFMLRKRFFQRAFDKVDHFISPSAYLAERFIEWGIPRAKMSVIPNGHRTSRPAGWTPAHSEELNIFGYFGQFVDAKGIDVLLAGRAHRGGSDGQAGRGQDLRRQQEPCQPGLSRPDRARRFADAPANLRVSEMGAYSRENVFDLMNSVDWVVVPSVWPETFGLVVSEAWEARRPILASRAGGLIERIEDRQEWLELRARQRLRPRPADDRMHRQRALVGHDLGAGRRRDFARSGMVAAMPSLRNRS
jgi:glycosyltransferase involved in cell wall biosynthesis